MRFVFALTVLSALWLAAPLAAQDDPDESVAVAAHPTVIDPALIADTEARMSPEAAAACNSAPPIAVTVIPAFPDPAYNFETSLQGVQQLAADSEHSIHESLTMGLTHYQQMVSIEAPVKGVTFENGLSCMHVDHLDVTVGYQDVVVYIPTEIPNPSCGFDTVMGHEMKHIGVNREVLNEFAPLFSQRFSEYLRTNGSFRLQRQDEALARLHNDLHTILQATYEQMSAENTRRQQLVDSPQEYHRISVACGGQLQNIAQLFRQNVHY